MRHFTLSAVVILLIAVVQLSAQTIPQTINYQGVLKDVSGVVVPNGDYNIAFNLYDVETGGGALWTETKVINVLEGIINTQLGSVFPITISFDKPFWLGITVEPGSELTPRIKLSSVPYSMMSLNVMDESISTNKLQNWAVTSTKIHDNAVTTSKIMDGTIIAQDIGNYEVVKKINGMRDSVNLVAGSNIVLTPTGNNITISALGGGSGNIGGSGTTNYLPLFTGSTVLGNSIIYQTAGGNIGIGTITPSAKLDISGSDALINGLTIGRGTGNIDGNSAFGYRALYSNTEGGNTANGYSALYYNTTGYSNTANGVSALYYNTEGDLNTANGMYALYANTTGSSNTALGYNAYPASGTLTNYTGIGYNVGGASSTSNSVEIGNTSVSRIVGQVIWSTYSDERIKDNVSENVPGLAFINKLRPVAYNLNIHKQNEIMYKGKKEQEDWSSKYDIEKIRMTGFIAQEVEQASKEAGFDFSCVDKPKNENDMYSIRYSEFVVPLVKAVQEQQKKIEELTRRIEELERR